MANKAFISYATEDRFIADAMVHYLEHENWEVFIDSKSIKAGQRIEAKIREALKNCTHVFVLLSVESIKSKWVWYEIGAAEILEKIVVPVIYGVTIKQIPMFLQDLLFVDLNNFRKYIKNTG